MYLWLSFRVYNTDKNNNNMKRSNLLLIAIALVVTIATVGCTTMAGTQDPYYDQEARVYSNRVYVDDPYRGTVVLEKDPRTGRYYDVTPRYDSYYGGSYGNVYSGRGYRNYGYGYPSRRSSGGGYYNGNTNSTNNTQRNDRSSEDYKKDRDDARNRVLGHN
jgi:hypothetical protein